MTHRKVIPAALMIVFFVIFIALRLSYQTFYPAKDYRDTISYLNVAEKPLTSTAFWGGERAFTLPLLYKLVGLNLQNYKTQASMEALAGYQTWLSILSWTILAWVVARQMRRSWVSILAFGFVLAFSLVYDIAKWDRLMLSESPSFSLLCLLLASWIGLLSLTDAQFKSLKGRLVFVATILVTIFYSFTRDANLYFVVAGAVIFAAAGLIQRFGIPRRFTLAYLLAVVLLFIVQNASINTENRWQIYIYDHLAYRIIPDPPALDFFVKAGLPVTGQLLQIPTMRGYVYQDLLFNDPSMEAVRQWTIAHGRQTYGGYLIANLGASLMLPLKNGAMLLNGTMAYGDPDHTQLFPQFPSILRGITGILFPLFSFRYYVAAYLGMLGITAWALLRGWPRGAWWTIAVIVVSIYPLMFMNWHGEPMEIERHALQVAIQFRLAFWLSLLFMLDHLQIKRASAQLSGV